MCWRAGGLSPETGFQRLAFGAMREACLPFDGKPRQRLICLSATLIGEITDKGLAKSL